MRRYFVLDLHLNRWLNCWQNRHPTVWASMYSALMNVANCYNGCPLVGDTSMVVSNSKKVEMMRSMRWTEMICANWIVLPLILNWSWCVIVCLALVAAFDPVQLYCYWNVMHVTLYFHALIRLAAVSIRSWLTSIPASVFPTMNVWAALAGVNPPLLTHVVICPRLSVPNRRFCHFVRKPVRIACAPDGPAILCHCVIAENALRNCHPDAAKYENTWLKTCFRYIIPKLQMQLIISLYINISSESIGTWFFVVIIISTSQINVINKVHTRIAHQPKNWSNGMQCC